MKTRHIFLILIFTSFISSAMAQSNVPGKISLAVLGGVNFQNLNGENTEGIKLENSLIVGYHIGINVQIPVAPEFYFQPGLQFSTKGSKYTLGDISRTTKLSYIELPLNFVYKGLLGTGYIFVGLGPYVAYGVGGKSIYKDATSSTESKIEFQNEVVSGDPLTSVYVKPFDAGGNIFFGYEMAGGLFMQVNAQLGMLNTKPDHYLLPDDRTTLKNTGYGLSLGYRF